jgi:hypothetical protein
VVDLSLLFAKPHGLTWVCCRCGSARQVRKALGDVRPNVVIPDKKHSSSFLDQQVSLGGGH